MGMEALNNAARAAGFAMAACDEPYEELRRMFEHGLRGDAPLYNEYHALIVRHAKIACKTRPLCGGCCLAEVCPHAARGG